MNKVEIAVKYLFKIFTDLLLLGLFNLMLVLLTISLSKLSAIQTLHPDNFIYGLHTDATKQTYTHIDSGNGIIWLVDWTGHIIVGWFIIRLIYHIYLIRFEFKNSGGKNEQG